jgi:hypothetical protein
MIGQRRALIKLGGAKRPLAASKLLDMDRLAVNRARNRPASFRAPAPTAATPTGRRGAISQPDTVHRSCDNAAPRSGSTSCCRQTTTHHACERAEALRKQYPGQTTIRRLNPSRARQVPARPRCLSTPPRPAAGGRRPHTYLVALAAFLPASFR